MAAAVCPFSRRVVLLTGLLFAGLGLTGDVYAQYGQYARQGTEPDVIAVTTKDGGVCFWFPTPWITQDCPPGGVPVFHIDDPMGKPAGYVSPETLEDARETLHVPVPTPKFGPGGLVYLDVPQQAKGVPPQVVRERAWRRAYCAVKSLHKQYQEGLLLQRALGQQIDTSEAAHTLSGMAAEAELLRRQWAAAFQAREQAEKQPWRQHLPAMAVGTALTAIALATLAGIMFGRRRRKPLEDRA